MSAVDSLCYPNLPWRLLSISLTIICRNILCYSVTKFPRLHLFYSLLTQQYQPIIKKHGLILWWNEGRERLTEHFNEECEVKATGKPLQIAVKALNN